MASSIRILSLWMQYLRRYLIDFLSKHDTIDSKIGLDSRTNSFKVTED